MADKPQRARKGSAPEQVPEVSDIVDGYTPFRIDTSGTPLDEGPRVPLFYVDDVAHTIPERIPAKLSLRALRVAAERGQDAAGWFLVENALSPESIHELTEGEASRHIEREQVRAMLDELGRRFFGQAQEDTSGK